MNPTKFHNLVRRVLSEELEKSSAVGAKYLNRVPEMNANGVDEEKKDKTFKSDSNSRDRQTKEALLNDLQKAVEGIDDTVNVHWDDHDDIMVNARDLKYIRISPRWEDYYVIEMLTRNEDRVVVTGQNWEQVKEFVKLNLKSLAKQPTKVDKAYDKSYRNREDQTDAPDKGLNQKDKPKTLPTTDEKPSTSKNREKNYTEEQVTEKSDLPNQPMKEVDGFKKQTDHKIKSPTALRKEKTKFPEKKPNTKLTVKM